MEALAILMDRYPRIEILPEPVGIALESPPCQVCGGETLTFIVKNGPPQTFKRGKSFHVQQKAISICLDCETDTGIRELSQCLGREAP
jgi:hypothetical protein